MAVFTQVDETAFARWASERFGFARVSPPAPIAEGIENSNYKFRADGADYVFTIFEVWDMPAVAYYLALTRHLSAKGLPVPAAVAAADSAAPARWQNDKPCAVVPFVRGASRPHTTPAMCETMGDLVARCHIAAADFAASFPNPRGCSWRQTAIARVRPRLTAVQQRIIDAAAAADRAANALPLPRAGCHCDLFRNNVLWDGEQISGIIDFYFGGDDALIFDLAVCACDWCVIDGEFCADRLAALLAGYSRRRHLCDLEKSSFTDILAVAATRFWVSRLYDIHFPRAAHLLTPHDPAPFEKILVAAQSMRPGVAKIMAQVA